MGFLPDDGPDLKIKIAWKKRWMVPLFSSGFFGSFIVGYPMIQNGFIQHPPHLWLVPALLFEVLFIGLRPWEASEKARFYIPIFLTLRLAIIGLLTADLTIFMTHMQGGMLFVVALVVEEWQGGLWAVFGGINLCVGFVRVYMRWWGVRGGGGREVVCSGGGRGGHNAVGRGHELVAIVRWPGQLQRKQCHKAPPLL